MLQVLTSIDDYDHIADIAKTAVDQITLIGYLDKPFKNFSEGDLLLHFGLNTSISGYSKKLLRSIKLYLMSQGFIVEKRHNKLIMLNEVIFEYNQVNECNYSYGLLLVKTTNGLTNFGIAPYEIYTLLLNIVNDYLKSINEEGDE